ncbi:MAG: TetR/AcrR family transcriptional regulator [Planctomycetota bacterium]
MVQTTRGRPREFDRDEALSRATEYFWEHGYDGSGMKDLLDSMGIARQSLYAAFGDKRSLFLEALKYYYSEHIAPLGARLNRNGSVVANFEAVFSKLGKDGIGGLERGCFLANTAAELASEDDEIGKVIQRYLTSLEKGIAKALRRGQEQGETRTDMTAESLAGNMVTTMQGAAVIGKLPHGRKSARLALRALLAMLVK